MAQSLEEIKKRRETLPVFRAKRELLQAIYRNKTIILSGETACGKTTQIPQYILEGGMAGNKCIAVTQPRRVAAVTIAQRVAEEVRTELGGKVGYSIRFENVTSSATKIKYLTDGMLLRESIDSPLLVDYSVIILDEAHERTLCMDILLGIVKLAQKLREQQKVPPLKIIVMSATLDYGPFSEYFDDAPAYVICGREYNIQILNTRTKQEDYVHSALVTVFQIHQNEDDGDILVFCTGQEEIDSMVLESKKVALELPLGCKRILPYALYSALPTDHQTAVFKPAPSGARKVIFSTNIAETSVTIPGIKYVIDTGMVKEKSYNSSGFDILSIKRISKAQADQRTGRAGREVNGKCYRLYTEEEYQNFKEHTVPEILRCCLSSAILQMVAAGIRNVEKFDFIDRPSDENIAAAIKQLKLLEAVVENDGILELTDCGRKMVTFPLDPRFSKMILTSKAFKCTDEILTIISLLSVDSIFYASLSQREKFAEVREKFESSEGDLIMLLNVYKAYKNVKGNPSWCYENCINSRNIKKAITVRKQLHNLCEKIGIKSCSCGKETIRIRKCLASGLFMNAAQLQKDKTYKMVEGNQIAKIHPSSCLFKALPSCCLYTELVQTSKFFMRNVTSIWEETLLEVAPLYFKDKPIQRFQLVPVIESTPVNFPHRPEDYENSKKRKR